MYNKTKWVPGDVIDTPEYGIACCNQNCVYLTDVFVEENREDKFYRCGLPMRSIVYRRAAGCIRQEDKYKTEW